MNEFFVVNFSDVLFAHEMDTTFGTLELVINGFVLTAVCITGLIGNIWLLATMVKHSKLWRQMRPFILYLAMCDAALLCVAWFLLSRNSLIANGFVQKNTWDIYTYAYMYALANLTYMGHIWGIASLTIERYLAICHPLWHRARKPRYLAAVFLCVTIIVSVCYSLPRLFETEVVELYDSNLSVIALEIRLTDLRANHLYSWLYQSLGHLIFMSCGPLALISVLTGCMIAALRQSTNMHRQLLGNRLLNSSPISAVEINPVMDCIEHSNYATVTHIHRLSVPQRSRGSVAITVKRYSTDGGNVRTHDVTHNFNKSLICLLLIAVFSYLFPTIVDLVEIFCSENQRLISYLTIFSNFMVAVDVSSAFFVYFACNKNFRKVAIGKSTPTGRHKPQQSSEDLQVSTRSKQSGLPSRIRLSQSSHDNADPVENSYKTK